jgi:hypothetical protein
MNTVKYFRDHVSVSEALSSEGSDTEVFAKPEHVPGALRDTMEELAFRSAVWYDPEGKALMFYEMTLDGVRPRGITDEDREGNHELEEVPVSGEKPRLLG